MDQAQAHAQDQAQDPSDPNQTIHWTENTIHGMTGAHLLGTIEAELSQKQVALEWQVPPPYSVQFQQRFDHPNR